MRYAIIQNNKIVNIAEATPEVASDNDWIKLPDGADIGWELDETGRAFCPKQDPEIVAFAIRSERDSLLQKTDWTQAVDIAKATQDKWAPYRQALRDVPQQAGFPNNVVWPQTP